jgi:hypothetical protein
MTFYSKPSINSILSLPILSRLQGSGETPLIPECNGNESADCGDTADLGLSCCDGCGQNAGDQVYISVLVTGSTCEPSPTCTIDQLQNGGSGIDPSSCTPSEGILCSEGCLVEFVCNYSSTSGVCSGGDPSSLSASITCDGVQEDCTPQPAP